MWYHKQWMGILQTVNVNIASYEHNVVNNKHNVAICDCYITSNECHITNNECCIANKRKQNSKKWIWICRTINVNLANMNAIS